METAIRTRNIIEQLAFLGYTPEEITADTYLYIDNDGLCGIEKHDRRAQPSDLVDGGEYVIAYGWLNLIREDLRQFLGNE